MAANGKAADDGQVSAGFAAVNTALGARPKQIKVNGVLYSTSNGVIDLGNLTSSGTATYQLTGTKPTAGVFWLDGVTAGYRGGSEGVDTLPNQYGEWSSLMGRQPDVKAYSVDPQEPTDSALAWVWESINAVPGRMTLNVPLTYKKDLLGRYEGTWADDAAFSAGQKAELDAIAAGQRDAYWDRIGASIQANAPTTLVRLGWECNGDWYPWGLKQTGENMASWRAAWEHAVTRMRAAAPQATFALDFSAGTPILGHGQTEVFDKLVGPQVDKLGVDIYDTWGNRCTGKTFTQDVLYPTDGWSIGLGHVYDYAASRRLNMALFETGVASTAQDGQGDDPDFIDRLYNWLVDHPWCDEHAYWDATAAGDVQTSIRNGSTAFPLTQARYKALFGPKVASPYTKTTPSSTSGSVAIDTAAPTPIVS